MSKHIEVTEKQNKFTSYLEWSDEGKHGIFRYIIGFVLIFLFFFLIGGFGLIPVKLLHSNTDDSLLWKNIATLSAFVIPFIFIPLITKWVHKRPSWSVAMAKPSIEKWNFATGFGVSLAVGVLATLFFGLVGVFNFEYVGFDWSIWIPLTIIGLIGIFIQASTEEMLFRGYITQFTRRITRNKYIFIFIPALLFALPHIANIKSLGGGFFALVPYLINGLLYGWAAYRSGSLWMSVGLHLTNNLGGLVLFGTKGDILKSVAPIQFELPSLTVTTLLILFQAVATVLVISFMLKRREATMFKVTKE